MFDNLKKTLYFDIKSLFLMPFLDWIRFFFSKYLTLLKMAFWKKDIHLSIGVNRMRVSTLWDIWTIHSCLVDVWIDVYKVIWKNIHTVIDVWGNIWQFSNAIKYWYPDAKVYTFEADPDIFTQLSHNTKTFDQISLFSQALSNKKTVLKFYRSEISWMSSLVQTQENQDFIEVETDMLDSVMNRDKSIDLLKIDVEWAELDVIIWSKNILTRTKYLLIEMSFERKWSNNLEVIYEIKNICPQAVLLHTWRKLWWRWVVTAQDFLFQLHK